MTNHWIDYQNSDVIMAIGVNTAENHPVSMKWINRARARGAKLIAVDPRFTRTAAAADLHVPIRPGTDIAFLGGLINYALQNNLIQEEYVRNYTNASYLIHPDFAFHDGVFSGLDTNKYDKASWAYQTGPDGAVRKDPTLQDPQCVFQLLKKHYARYTPEKVSQITGCPVETFLKAAELFCSTGRPDKAGNILYAMGITQHTYGSQNVRAIAILQLLLGNIGIAGGGVNAQRGEANVQGSTDMALLYHYLPGYLGHPKAALHPTLKDYIEKETPKTSYWSNKPKFLVSLLKAWYGQAATADNDFAYDYLPKLDARDHSHISIFEHMAAGEIKGFFAWGQNPAVGGPQAMFERSALEKLDWMVVVDIFETETAAFWKRPGANPQSIKTEVFLLPAAISYEKEGSVANSGRWIQWRYKACDPPGEARSDLWIADRLYKAIRAEYEKGGVFPDPILNLTWDYGGAGEGEPDTSRVALEINGYDTATGSPLANFPALKDDGSTACGCWIYSGYYNDLNNPPCKKRQKEEAGIGTHPNWAYAWPLNRRILYNRCSSDPAGKPWNAAAPVIWWENGEWKRNDVPDFGWKAADGSMIPPEKSAANPFIMLPEGQGRLFAAAMADGPFPEHYEPVESPVANLLSRQQNNPVVVFLPSARKWTAAAVGEFPLVATTYRLSEHWQSGIMTRNSPWLNELMPEMFVEISPGLARKLGIASGDKVVVYNRRSAIIAKACVTPRLQPLVIGGQEVEVVGMPWHWGYQGLSAGPSANELTPHVGDANTNIPEYKAFLCAIRRA